MNQTTLWIFSWILLWGTSCQPSRLEQALTLARENREELEQVLEHYKEDPEKLKAARFLIENMPGHHSCVGEEVKRYYDQIDSICTLPATVQEQKVMIEKASARVDPSKLKYVADVRVLTAQFLIAHIDQAFRQWKELGWNNHLLFDDFCEYLLPYKSTEGEYPELWSIALQSVHSGDLDNMHACDYFKKSSFWVCKEVNDTMPRRSLIKYNALPILRLTTLVRMPFSRSCDEHTLMTQALMRSKGIPVATDYTPQWPRHGEGHTWSVLLSHTGKTIVFSGGESSPGENHKHDEKRAKVFRYSYASNPDLEKLLLSGEKPPAIFSRPFIKDVTGEYERVVDVVCPIDRKRRKESQYAYLCLSYARQWNPVHWGEIKGDEVCFTNMGKDCVYLPVVYSNEGQIPIGYPFHLNNQGERVEFVPNIRDTLSYTFKRKFPIHGPIYWKSKYYYGARFEASNQLDFEEPDTLFTIQDRVYSTLSVDMPPKGDKYRYWRFITSKGAFYNNTAELLFYDRQTGQKLTGGKPIGSKDSISNSSSSKEVVFDNDGLSYFFSSKKDSTWVGLDFGEPVDVGRIVYAPRSDDNNVWPGHVYDLKYWGENGWVSLGVQQASDIQLTYSNIPCGALLLLTNLTRGKEERIFSIEGGRIVWW